MNGIEFAAEFDKQKAKLKTVQQELYERLQQIDGMDKFLFAEVTELNEEFYGKICRNQGNFSTRIIVTICIAFGINLEETKEILGLGSHVLGDEKYEFAYKKLFEENINDIVECNEKLAEWGISKKFHLGSRSYNK